MKEKYIDALNETTISLNSVGTTCQRCGQRTDQDGSVMSCYFDDCDYDVMSHYELDYDQELDFNE